MKTTDHLNIPAFANGKPAAPTWPTFMPGDTSSVMKKAKPVSSRRQETISLAQSSVIFALIFIVMVLIIALVQAIG